jgi:hypothetical protein
MKGAHADCRARLRRAIQGAALVLGATLYTFREFAGRVGHPHAKCFALPMFVVFCV